MKALNDSKSIVFFNYRLFFMILQHCFLEFSQFIEKIEIFVMQSMMSCLEVSCKR